jgi:CRISPR-associated endonuclease/helicase Cas3
MSSSFKLKSHRYDSEYKLLYEHLNNVGRAAKEIVSDKSIKDKELFMDIAYLIGISHDFAKSTTYFQDHLKMGERTEKAYHGKLSSIFGYYLVRKYLKLKNKLKDTNRFLPAIAWLVILKHHSDINDLMGTMGELEKLDDLEIERKQISDIRKNHFLELKVMYEMLKPSTFEINLEEFFNEFDEICEKIKVECEEMVMKQEIENYFKILFFYSVLLDADKLDASNIDFEKIKKEREKWKDIPEDIVDKYKKVKFIKKSELNSIRNECYNEVISNLMKIKGKLDKERIFSIELPTGFGKTLTAFSFALKLRKIVKERLGFSPKIIYSLPFLSIIDQNAEVISEVLTEYVKSFRKNYTIQMWEEETSKVPTSLLLKHHHLSDIFYKTSEEELIKEPERSLLLIEGWHSEIIITSFVQFFHSLITNKNKAARKFHNIVNSIIILDEVQSIPYKYWSLVREALKHIALNYNCWIILMTATQPLIFRKKEVVPLVKNRKKYFKRFNRVKYFVDIKEKDFDEFKHEIFNEIIKTKEDFAIILNTINASKELYEFLRDKLKKVYNEPRVTEEGTLEFGDTLLINLSTHILPIHRIERIRKIRSLKNKRKVIVTTQLIEAGVDMSVGIIYRDFAPLDCIIQSGGRCNRNNEKKKGICKVIYLKHKDRNFCRIYDNTLLNATRGILNKEVFEEKDINSLVQKYFKKILEYSSDKESEDSTEAMRKLNFTEVGKFELIENEKAKVDVFIDINEESSEIWSKYNEIMSIKNRFERRNKFLGIRNNFYSYIIQVYREDAKKYWYDPSCSLGYLQKENYDIETGFKSGEMDGLIW